MLLQQDKRADLFKIISNRIAKIAIKYESLKYKEIKLVNQGLYLPILFKHKKRRNGPLLMFMGAQHNEYNGTFGILDFFQSNPINLLDKW
ncbi:MAG: hypothetical protein GF364_19035, partial [Candidatus Lokiarchaeota archaeon]|nr:hypothetical protein [Candidatus Lokiarchaeota archaeon]